MKYVTKAMFPSILGKPGSINMKVLLEKVKYLQLTHGLPQGDSEKAKKPTRCKKKIKKKENTTPSFTTFTFHPVPAFIMDQTPKLNGHYGHANILPT